MKVSYQTRIKDLEAAKVLDLVGPPMARATRILFSKISKFQAIDKPQFQKDHFLTSRLFNSCHNEAQAKFQNAKENKANQVDSLKTNITAVQRDLTKPKIVNNPFKLHHKRRHLQRLQDRLAVAELEIKNREYSCIFGSKNLWKQQFHLEANNYESHGAWRDEWEAARDYNFQILGSHDETMGNLSCQLSQNLDGSYDLDLKLPTNFPQKHLEIKNLVFFYGQDTINKVYYQNLNKTDRQAITYRFHKDAKGWILTLTTELAAKELITNHLNGILGVDINHDHLAVSETDRYGNLVKTYTFSLDLEGKSHHQALTAIGEASKALVALALSLQKHLGLEKLDFETKKAMLAATHSPEYAKMLSSFAYSAILKMIKARAYKHGVGFLEVNPAFTSFIGLLKFTRRYGLTIHHAAALVISRRCQHLSERLPHSPKSYQLRIKEVQVTLEKPVDSSKHVWSSWGKLKRQMETFWKKRRTKDPKRDASQKDVERGVMTKQSSAGTRKLNPKKAVPS